MVQTGLGRPNSRDVPAHRRLGHAKLHDLRNGVRRPQGDSRPVAYDVMRERHVPGTGRHHHLCQR